MERELCDNNNGDNDIAINMGNIDGSGAVGNSNTDADTDRLIIEEGTTEEINTETMEVTMEEITEEINKGTTEEINKETMKVTMEETTEVIYKETTVVNAKETREVNTKENMKEYTEKNSEENTANTIEDKDTMEETTYEVSAKDKKLSDSKVNSKKSFHSIVIKEKFQGVMKSAGKFIHSQWNNDVRISRNNLLYPALFFLGTFVFLELVLHLMIYKSIDIKIIYPILFAFPISALFTFITGLFPRSGNKIAMWILTVLTVIVFQTQLIYNFVFKVYFSFQTLGMAGDAISEFGVDILTAVKANIGGLILLFLPLLLLALVMNNRIDFERRNLKGQGILLSSFVTSHVIVITALLLFGIGDYSPYDLYFNTKVHELCGKQLGIATMTRIDIGALILGKDELVLADTMSIVIDPAIDPETTPTSLSTPIPTPEITSVPKAVQANATPTPTLPPTPTPIDNSPNVMNIDFNELAEKEKENTIQTLHKYFASVTPTNKNEYTGMFKGYNLIMITAEGFSPYAINEVKTPTLYQLVREGFVFNNFYTALWQTSTSDGEYVAMTGLIPTGTRSMFNGRTNLWPFSLGNQFNLLGVNSKAYHNHTYTYYQRDETHPNLGYDFKAKDHGLVLEHPDVWPASDLELINASVDDFMKDDQFHVYYLTVSGHMNYTFAGNSMSYKNRDHVKDLPYSSDARAYIACQMELDKALEQLIAKLELAGVADRTVIALSADHYPYGWEKKNLDELAGYEVDTDFEIYRNHFILWNAAMKENIVINEPCSSLDIVPTLSNLFGLEYDSRLLMGQDILSDAAPLVPLSNRSFITDKVMYNSETGEATMLTQEALPENYIRNLNKVIKNKFTVAQSILQNDYYRYVFPEDSK